LKTLPPCYRLTASVYQQLDKRCHCSVKYSPSKALLRR
jgi:hypothetical protein